MKTVQSNRFLKTSLRILCLAFALAASSAWAAFTTWDLNPENLNAPVGDVSHPYTVDAHTITAYGFDNNAGTGTPSQLYFKHELGDPSEFEHGLGLVNTLHHELQVGPNGSPLQFIQFDLTSILAAGFIHGQVSMGSVQAGELWAMYGSNALGTLGTLLNGVPFGSDTNGQFVDIPDFGTFHFISVVSAGLDSLPIALQAELAPIPEAATLLPVALLAISATLLEIRRRRTLA